MNVVESSPHCLSVDQKRALLAEKLKRAVNRNRSGELSFAQQRLWFLDQLEPNSPLYNVATLARLKGPLDTKALSEALNILVQRHEALRSRFTKRNNIPEQELISDASLQVELADLSLHDSEQRQAELNALVRKRAACPFNLDKDLLIRATLIQLDKQSHALLLVVHHIVSDEWSLKVLFDELAEVYTAALEGRQATLPALPFQYSEYAARQREWLSSNILEKQLTYWKQQLRGQPAITELPTDRTRPAEPSFKGATTSLQLDPELTAELHRLARNERATLFMVLLGALHVLVHRYTRQEDLIIGSPIAGRTRVEIESLVGFFVNTLPLRAKVQPDVPFADFLAGVRETTLDAYANQDVPFERIVQEVQPLRTRSHMPFSRVMFALQNRMLDRMKMADIQIEFLPIDIGTAKFDLTLTAQETTSGLMLRAEYSTEVFERGTIDALLGHYRTLLRRIIECPAASIRALSLLDAEEELRLLGWANGAPPPPTCGCVHELFEAQTDARPDALAVKFGSQQYTYGELNSRANQLARHLRNMGCKPGQRVALCVERSCEMVVGMLSVLKIGAIYVPLDPGFPRERLSFMIADAGATVVLTQTRLRDHCSSETATTVLLDSEWDKIGHGSPDNLDCQVKDQDPAYIMYTSGSTGTPKGVVVPHRAITRLVRNSNYLDFGPEDRVAQLSNVAFDAATFEIWGALLNGAVVVGFSKEVALSPLELAEALKHEAISALFLTTALFNSVASKVPSAFAGVKHVLFGGETVDPKWVRTVLQAGSPARLLHVYGPTENTTFSTWHLVENVGEQDLTVPIGKPISGTQCYVLDSLSQLVPAGIPGELYLSGAGLACGYWNSPELTSSRFVSSPLKDRGSGPLLYKTGDLARWRQDGALEFLGRMDDQVKLRGFRIEPGEIRSVLNRHSAIADSFVALDDSPMNREHDDEAPNGTEVHDRRLVAYVVPKNGSIPGTSELKRFLSRSLPDYMTPSVYVSVSSLPLNANGKLDRSALPRVKPERPDLERRYTAPRDAVELQLAKIWEQVLGVSPVGVSDGFFELGGHSLLAVKLVSEIEKVFGKPLRLATIFTATTVEQLAAVIREEIKENSLTSGTSLVPIQAQGDRPALFLVHGAGGGMFWGYVNLSGALGGSQPVYGFRARALEGKEEWESIPEMAAQYVRDLKAIQPHGPYHLGGYCFGGNVAYEMACQLQAQGDRVALLALFNCAPPNSSYGRIPWSVGWAMKLAKNLGYWLGYFNQWSRSQRSEFFRWKWSRFKSRLFGFRGHQGPGVDVGNLVDLSAYTPEQRRLWEAHIRALASYKPRCYSGRVHLFRSPGHPLWCSFADDYGWGEFVREGLQVTIVPAPHEKILENPCVGALASHLKAVLDQPEKVEASSDPASRMAMFRGLALRASLFWFGAEGMLALETAAESSGLTLASLFQSLAVLGGAAGGGSRTDRDTSSRKDHPDQPSSPERKVQPTCGQVECQLPELASSKLLALSREEQVSPRVTLLAACRALLARCAPDGVATLSPSGAPTPDATDAVSLSCLINELVLRVQPSSELSFRGLVAKMRSALSAHGDARARMEPLMIENPDDTVTTFVDIRLHANLDDQSSESDLKLMFEQRDSRIWIRLTFNSNLFDPSSANRYVAGLEALITAGALNPDTPLYRLPLLGRGESDKILREWNNTRVDLETAVSYPAHFAQRAKKSPSAVAARMNGSAITYSELNDQANRLANHLRQLGVGPEVLVGVCLERSLELLVALLAVWKAGGAYIPLDPSYPSERLTYMVADAKPTLLISSHEFAPIFGSHGTPVICVDDRGFIEQIARSPVEDPPILTDGRSLAYVIYTSGSTGNPKGVEITHSSLLNHNLSVIEIYRLEPRDRVLQFTPISFDISVEEIFPSLLRGCTLVFRSEGDISSPDRFLKFVTQEGVTVLNIPTAYWHELVEHLASAKLPACVRLVIIGGEKASPEAFRRWKKRTRREVKLMNSYGPTETTVTATVFQASHNDEVLNIGRPIANTHALVLDEHLQLVPVGVPGELYLGGAGIARGYLHRPDLTAEKFVRNPFQAEIPSPRLYKTGDLACYLPDGNLQFLGRTDHQVKIRGFRIELGEIEAVLQTHNQLADAVVIAREDVPGQKRLVAYFVPRAGAKPAISELLQLLRSKLPAYMVPSAFVSLSELPLTPAGKVNRRALPQPDNHRPELQQEFVGPRTPIEEVLARIWCEVLGLDQVGICDNFFDLGGHSLLATQLLARIRDAFGIDISLASLFSLPTVKLLAENLAQSSNQNQPALQISAMKSGRRVTLSISQERIWFLDQFDPRQSPYNIALGVSLSGPMDRQILEQSLTILTGRHEGLRSVFPVDGGKPVQFIYEPRPAALQVVDLTHLPPGERVPSAKAFASEQARKPYIVSSPMLQPILFRLSETEHWLLLILHEIAADRPSLRLVFRELTAIYHSLSSGQGEPSLPASPSYEALQAAHLALSEAEQQAEISFWREKLAGAPICLELPADRPRQAVRSDDGARVPLKLSQDLCHQLEGLARSRGGAIFHSLLAGYTSLLHRYTGATDIVVGTTIENRRALLQNAVGRFSNQVAMRNHLGGNPQFLEILQRTIATVEEGREHGRLPFGVIVDTLHPERSLSHTPFFQVSLQFEEQPLQTTESGRVQFKPIEISNDTAKLDLALYLERNGTELTGWLEFSTALFDIDRVERLAQHFEVLLRHAAHRPDSRLSELQLMPAEEWNRVTQVWNQTDASYDLSQTLHERFRDQASRTPQAEALIAGPVRLTYAELYARADCIGHLLRERGVGNHMRTGVCLERSWEMLACILGTLQAGAAYVPMDPAYPAERLKLIARDSGVSVLLTSRRLLHLFPDCPTDIVCIEDVDWHAVGSERSAGPASPNDLAYVIYTSGSTGQPKGVAIEHRNVMALLHWAEKTFTPRELSGVLAATSVCFDLSVFEMFVPLCTGGRVILAENALELATLPVRHQVKLVNTVPSAMRELLRLKAVPPEVTTVNLAGEPLSTDLVDAIYAQTKVQRVYDLYGPTETTTYSTGGLRQRGQPATIGKPLMNEQVYVLDAHLQPVPIGIGGELHIGGAGVARGYLNRADLTAERFIPNPFGEGRLYKTGDLARWRADGTLEYLGRLDHQVKIRGFRIEPGEIEAILKRHENVTDCVVLAEKSATGDARLIAYVVLDKEGTTDAGAVRAHLQRTLPAHMVPGDILFIPKLPLSPNGKIDRKALLALDCSPAALETPFVAPCTLVEEQLALIWQEVLGRERVGVLDRFFDLGGHSLLAVRLVARIREVFKVELPLFGVFEADTIRTLADGLCNGRWAENQQIVVPLTRRPPDCAAPASYVQERLWFLDQLQPGSDAYNVPAALRIKGLLNSHALAKALSTVLQRHESLRTTLSYRDGEVFQIIAPDRKVDLRTHSISPADEQAVEQWINREAQKPFDLEAGPLVRTDLLRISEADHVLLVSMHHSVSDGWSVTIFFQEVEACYNALATSKPAPILPELPVQYPDYARWQRQWIQGKHLERELAYWKQRLAGAPTSLDLPADFSQTSSPERKAGNVQTVLDLETSRALVALGQKEGATPFMVLMTALVTMLHKWTGQKDQVIGTVVAGRSRKELERVIGCFMNFLPIRTRLQGQETGRQLLQKVRTTVLEAQMHGECPFEKMVEAINPERRRDRNPLYNVALLLQNYPNDLFHAEGLESSWMPTRWHAPLLDLRFEAELTPQGLSIICEYKTELFESATIGELVRSFQQVIQHLVREPDNPLACCNITPGLAAQARGVRSHKEKHTIAIAANFTVEPVEDTLHHWLRQFEIPGEVRFASYSQVFQELLDSSSLLGTNSRGINVVCLRLQDWARAEQEQEGRDTLSEPALERNVEEFVTALRMAASRSTIPWLVVFCPSAPGWLAGHRYAPLLAAKEHWVAETLKGCSGVIVVTSEELLNLYPVQDYADPSAEDLGHVPYTPVFFAGLGTMIARKFHATLRLPAKVVVLDCDQTLWCGVCGEDGAQKLGVNGPWLELQKFMRAQHDAGKLLCLCSKNNEQDVEEVFARRTDMPLRREHFASVRLNWETKSENIKSLARELQLGLDSFIFIDDNPVECAEVQANCPEVLTLQLPEDPQLIPGFLEHCWAFDQLKVTAEDRKRTALYRQNQEREQLRSRSVTLADFIAGLGLQIQIEALNSADLTRVTQLTQRTNQFNFTTRRRTETDLQQSAGPGEILTVTVSDRFGDYGLVGVLIFQPKNGNLEVETFLLSCRVLGRGVEHRMLAHLGEVARQRGCEFVDLHFVRSPKNKPALDFLEAVGASHRQPLNGGYVYRLPTDYAARIQFQPQQVANPSPSKTNGQPNEGNQGTGTARPFLSTAYRSLALEANTAARIYQAVEARLTTRTRGGSLNYTPPRSDLERQLCEVWQRLLHVERVGIQDNFFDLGGHSLLAVRLFAEIEKIIHRKFPLVTLFQAPTVQQLASLLSQGTSGTASLLVPIQPNGSRPPLILVHGAGGDVLWGYANLAAQLGPDQPLYGIKSRGQIGQQELTSIEEMARCYLEAVREFQPAGPYYLGGYCFGGNVAYEMARQLRAQGEEVALVALLDSSPSGAGYERIPWWNPGFVFRFSRNLLHWLRDFAGLKPQDRKNFVTRKARAFGRKVAAKLGLGGSSAEVDLEEVIDLTHFPDHELKLWQVHLQALVEHMDQPYEGRVVLLRTLGQPLFCSLEHDFCWGKLVRGGVQVQLLPGSHENVFMEPHVRKLATALQGCLLAATDHKHPDPMQSAPSR